MTKCMIRLLAFIFFYTLVDVRSAAGQDQALLDSCLFDLENASDDLEKMEALESLTERLRNIH